MSLVRLPDKVARDLEVVFGLNQDCCRLCSYYWPPEGMNSLGRCKRWYNKFVEALHSCEEFTRI